MRHVRLFADLHDGRRRAFFRPLPLVCAGGDGVVDRGDSCHAGAVLILLPGSVEKHGDAWLSRVVRAGYAAILPSVLKRPLGVYAVLTSSLVAALTGFFFLKKDFLPDFQETDFSCTGSLSGTSLEVMTKDIKNVGREVLDETDVKEYGSHIARRSRRGNPRR